MFSSYTNERYTAPMIFDVLERTEDELLQDFPDHTQLIRHKSDETFDAIQAMMDNLPERMQGEKCILPQQVVIACAMRIGCQVRAIRMRAMEQRYHENPPAN